MNSINNLPILDLNQDNIEHEWQGLINTIKDSSFIGIDIVNVNYYFIHLKIILKIYF